MKTNDYYTTISDKHIDCSVGYCCHFDCINKSDTGCKLASYDNPRI